MTSTAQSPGQGWWLLTLFIFFFLVGHRSLKLLAHVGQWELFSNRQE